MTTSHSSASMLERFDPDLVDEAEIAAASFLARYNGRTLEAYRYDLRCFFQWAADAGLVVLETTRSRIEVYRSWLEERGLAASTIDRRLSTVCGFYRFAHIDGRIPSDLAVTHQNRLVAHRRNLRGGEPSRQHAGIIVL